MGNCKQSLSYNIMRCVNGQSDQEYLQLQKQQEELIQNVQQTQQQDEKREDDSNFKDINQSQIKGEAQLNKVNNKHSINQKEENQSFLSILDQADSYNSIQTSQLFINKSPFISMKQKRFEDEYRVQSLIGEGSFSKIYLAKNKENKKLVVKVIRQEEYLEEYQILKQLENMKNHKNIIKLYDVHREKDQLKLVLEYIKGENLAEILTTQKRIEETKVKIIMKQILQGLSFCHKNGIIHRDIKLENIMCKYFETQEKLLVKIIDFGHSIEENKKQSNKLVGTIVYLSPESCEGHYSYKSDV